MLILHFIIGFQSQSINLTNSFARVYIPIREIVFHELPRDFSIDGGQCDVVLRLKKSLYGQSEAAHLWCEKLRNVLLARGFVISKVDPCLFISNIVICVVYMDDCLFWARSQSQIDNVIKSFKEDGPSYNW